MKINRIIREKRKALSLTQEQIADVFADMYEALPASFVFQSGCATMPICSLL